MEPISLKKIGEVAALLGTTPRALRFYEEEGLVSARRTSGGTRLYADNDIARFRAILHLAHSGIPLGLIKELATAREKYTGFGLFCAQAGPAGGQRDRRHGCHGWV